MRRTSWQIGAVLALWALVPRFALGAIDSVNDSSTAGDVPFPGCASMGAGVASAVTSETGVAAVRLRLGTSASTTVRASLPHVLGAGEVTFTATASTTTPDAGSDAGADAGGDAGPPGSFDVSCNCASGGRTAVLAMLRLAAAFRRRPRQHP